MGIGDIYIIAKYSIVANFKGWNSQSLALRDLKINQPGLGIAGNPSNFIQLRINTITNQTTILDRYWGFINDKTFQLSKERTDIGQGFNMETNIMDMLVIKKVG